MENAKLTELTADEMTVTSGGGFGCWLGGALIGAGVWTLDPLAVTVGVIMVSAHCK